MTAEKIECINLNNEFKMPFGKMMDDFISVIPQEKLNSPAVCFTIKQMLMDNLVFGNTTFASRAWYDEEKHQLKVMIVYYLPYIVDFYKEAGMCCICVVENGTWRISFCTTHKEDTSEEYDYKYMKNLGHFNDLKVAYNNWREYFENMKKED